jgi:hypothetical protein
LLNTFPLAHKTSLTPSHFYWSVCTNAGGDRSFKWVLGIPILPMFPQLTNEILVVFRQCHAFCFSIFTIFYENMIICCCILYTIIWFYHKYKHHFFTFPRIVNAFAYRSLQILCLQHKEQGLVIILYIIVNIGSDMYCSISYDIGNTSF